MKRFFIRNLLALFLIFSSLAISVFSQEETDSCNGRIIKEIRIKGLKRTKEYIVKRELISQVGKPLLESGLLPDEMAHAADRTTFDRNTGSLLNPVNLGIAVLNLFDRPNKIDEPPDKSTVNLAIKGWKPG